MRLLIVAALAATCVAVFTSLGTAEDGGEPTLLARAILPSDAYQPGPTSGAADRTEQRRHPAVPRPNGQPIPGFSAVLDAGHGEFWGMPDNGYGAKTNSADFLLRLYRIRPDFKTATRRQRHRRRPRSSSSSAIPTTGSHSR